MSIDRLALARAAVLDRCETVFLSGIEFKVPPVPHALMNDLCDLIKAWGDLEKNKPTSTLDWFSSIPEIVAQTAKLFWLTVSTLDEEIEEEEITLLMNAQNFFDAHLAMMRASGLTPKEPVTEVAIDGEKKPVKKIGRTGTK